MFSSVKKYFSDRKRTILSATAFIGGTYLAGHYALRRLEEMREKLVEDKTAKENLRNRFIRNQEDCIFTSQALVPAFGNQILEQLDVEALTLDIQYYGKPRPAPPPAPSTPPPHPRALSPESSVPAASPISGQDRHNDLLASSIQDHTRDATSESWVKEFSASQIGVPPEDLPLPPPRPHELSPPRSASVSPAPQPLVIVPNELGLSESASEAGDLMTSSVYTESSISPEGQSIVNVLEPSSIMTLQRTGPSVDASGLLVPSKTKAELWKEVRVMTFTRTLTILYTLTLLTLQTHIQLNLLASFKYIQSVYEMEAEQKERERQEGWWGSIKSPMDRLLGSANASASSLLSRQDWDEMQARVVKVTELSERKYLTISWWLLNIGWKDVKDKVETAVAEVFSRVPLKSELTLEDLRQRINEVRMKVEHAAQTHKDGGGDELTESEQEKLQGVSPQSGAPLTASTTRRTEWESVLIPLTNASEQQALLAGGLPPDQVLSNLGDIAFRTLMDDTRQLLNGQEFGVVFDKAMDWGVDWFLERVQREMFESGHEEQREGEEKEVKKVKLAAMLPGVARLSHTLVNSMPNELIEGMSQLPEMSAFSAIIFASYEERLRPQDEMQ